MIIKSHVRGGYRAAATYLKDVGLNEKVRLVEISDTDARTLDEAFHNMWTIGSTTKAKKPLHHVSINPRKNERLSDGQVLQICARLEERYGYKSGEHQRVIVEHVKDGRQHFHVIWNRVNLCSGRPVWPGHHWLKSKQTAREMEAELGLKRPTARRKRVRYFGKAGTPRLRSVQQIFRRTHAALLKPLVRPWSKTAKDRASPPRRRRLRRFDEEREVPIPILQRPAMSAEEVIAWAWEHRRSDILALYGIYVTFDL